jgi:hypothetical protein
MFTPYITLLGERRYRRPPTIYVRVMGVNANRIIEETMRPLPANPKNKSAIF